MKFTKCARARRNIFAISLATISAGMIFPFSSYAEDEPAGVYFSRDAASAATPANQNAPDGVTGERPLTQKVHPAKKARSAAPSSVHAMVTESALKHRVPVALAHGIVKVESGYNCSAHSRSGAVGIMQTLRATARGVGVTGALTDCATGLEAGMRYLRLALEAHGGGCAGLSAYQRGIRSIGRCTEYGRKVLALASQG